MFSYTIREILANPCLRFASLSTLVAAGMHPVSEMAETAQTLPPAQTKI